MNNYLRRHGTVFMAEGVAVIVLGLAAIVVPTLFTMGIELLIGALLLVGGILTLLRGWRLRELPGFGIAMVTGTITALVGLVLLAFPVEGLLTLTLLLAVFFFLEGVSEIVFAFRQHRGWAPRGWIVLSGAASIVIAVLLLIKWPSSAAWAIGLLVGVSLLFTGWWLLLFGLAIRRAA